PVEDAGDRRERAVDRLAPDGLDVVPVREAERGRRDREREPRPTGRRAEPGVEEPAEEDLFRERDGERDAEREEDDPRGVALARVRRREEPGGEPDGDRDRAERHESPEPYRDVARARRSVAEVAPAQREAGDGE